MNGVIGVITIPIEDYKKLSVDAADGKRLKDFLREICKHYHSLNHSEISMICDLFGIKEEDDIEVGGSE